MKLKKIEYYVAYVSGYIGMGINRTEREVYATQKEADKRADELRKAGVYGVKTFAITIY